VERSLKEFERYSLVLAGLVICGRRLEFNVADGAASVEPVAQPTHDGASYTGTGEQLGCDCKTVDNALQRVNRKVGAHLRSRDVLL
jgi:hypothetical protein